MCTYLLPHASCACIRRYKKVVGALMQHLDQWNRSVHYPTPQLASRLDIAWLPWRQPVCFNC